MLTINDRISLDNALGTVRFIGYLDVWGSGTVAYGVEWDDPHRGKNSGSHNGVQYFQTRVEGAGLFLKASNKKIVTGVSLMDAILRRYAGEENELALNEKIQIGSKTVESYGFQKLNALLRDITALKTIMLDRQNVLHAGDLVMFPNTETLDLSFNLLARWSELETILQYFPKLKSLNLNGNRFSGPLTFQLPSLLSEILLAASKVTVDQINMLNISNLDKLILASNDWTLGDIERLLLPPSVVFLDISFNQVSSIPNSIQLSNVRHLNMGDNIISTVSVKDILPNVVTLDLRYNRITSWESIDKLSQVFPNMKDLRIDNCPLFAKLSIEEMTVEIIARLECGEGKLSQLNGSMLSAEEIRNAELYFISKVQLGAISFTNERRMKQLLEKYNISSTPRAATEDSRKISLQIQCENGIFFTRDFLKSNSVLRLKGVISKKIAVSLLRLKLYFYLHGIELDDTRQYLSDDIASLQSYVLSANQKVYVSLSAS